MRCPTLVDLPPPPAGKTGWPWTAESPANDFRGPTITIVTASFNHGQFLEETIRSVLLQGYSDLEYIVIDGGSSDGSIDIIRKYEPYLAYWVSENDGGPADAIRKGFRKATGSILGWLNSDDTYRPAALPKVAAAFHANPDVDVVYGNTYWVGVDGEVLGERRQTPFSKSAYLYGGADLQQPSTFWTSRIYWRVGGLGIQFTAAFDTDLFCHFFAAEARFQHIAEFLSAFRIHSGQISDVMLERSRLEVDELRARFVAFPVTSLRGCIVRNFGRIQRLFRYARQGDLPWLIGRIPDRVKSRFVREATGPRSRWT